MNQFVLVDCNNFYASCERLFNPRLEGRPVIVLSNNDGCVVARSQEAKQLGIAMGAPYFKIQDFCRQQRVAVFSSNYALYGDLSQRVMELLAERAPAIQVYSIDEAFLMFPATEKVALLCSEMRQMIRRWTGIPTSLGIAPTKTLAKVANQLAKKEGIFDLSCPHMRDKVLHTFPIGDVWGIGGRSEEKLRALGIETAWQLAQMPAPTMRRTLGVVGERLLLELRGISCLPLTDVQLKKSLAYGRSFGKPVADLFALSEALATYVANASLKLREQAACTAALYVYLETCERQHYSQAAVLPLPTNDTPQLITAAKSCLRQLFRKEERYKKCGVVLLDLLPQSAVVPDLFQELDPKRRKLAGVVDALNTRLGRHKLYYAAMGGKDDASWKMRSERRSPNYTGRWEELAVVKAVTT